jgi:uncharacterized membrane protein
MPIFMVLIILSLSFYVYFKVKYFRVKEHMHKKWISAKSSVALGAFITSFGINQWIAIPSKVSMVVGIIFLIVGIGSIRVGIKAYRYYLPLVIEEANNKRQ